MGIANYRHRTKLIVAIFVLYIFVLFCGATGPSSSSASSRGDLSNPPSGMEYEYVIERAEPKHAPELRSLIQELANFQGYPNGPQIGANQLAQDLGRGAVYGFIAYTKGRSIAEGGEYEAPELAGMVLYYYPCYSWVGESLHMEDLFVRPKFRRSSLATRLVRELMKEILRLGLVSLNWDVLASNTGAIQFYKKRISPTDRTSREGVIMWQLREEAFDGVLEMDAAKRNAREDREFEFRMADPTDADDVHKLSVGLATVEGHSENVEFGPERMAEYLRRGVMHALLAYRSGELAGMAVYRWQYSTWLGQYLWLDDLFIVEKHRGQGLGLAIMAQLVQVAKSRGMKRIGWYAVDWNTPALQFYEKIGGRNLAQKDGWLNFRIFLDDINCLVREESNDLSSEKNQ